jgi:hypothetical protein
MPKYTIEKPIFKQNEDTPVYPRINIPKRVEMRLVSPPKPIRVPVHFLKF